MVYVIVKYIYGWKDKEDDQIVYNTVGYIFVHLNTAENDVICQSSQIGIGTKQILLFSKRNSCLRERKV